MMGAGGDAGAAGTAAATAMASRDDRTRAVVSESAGLVPRLLDDVFSRIAAERRADDPMTHGMRVESASDAIAQSTSGRVVELRVSFVEILNEQFRDLLVGAPNGAVGGRGNHGQMTPAEIEAAQAQVPRIDVRAGADGIVRARGLTRARCANESDVLELLARGAAMRATAATRMNQHSSRSHAVLTLELIRERPSPASVPSVPAAGSSLGRANTNMSNNHKGKSSGSSGSIVTCAKLHLVDLAGSERAKRTGTAGARFKESVRINEVRILNL